MNDAIPDWIIWVLLIFAAGVVGQFGKALTTRFLDSFKDEEKPETETQVETVVMVEKTTAESGQVLTVKAQKKLDKAESKRIKKDSKAQAKAEDCSDS